MRNRDEFDFEFEDRPSVTGSIITAAGAFFVIAAIAAVVWFVFLKNGDRETAEPDVIVGESVQESVAQGSTVQDSAQDASGLKDSQGEQDQVGEEQGVETEASKILVSDAAAETAERTMGIDVSRYQGNIDWQQVAGAGIDFAMVRVGYRTMENGAIVEDETARYNLQEATANGIKVGAYFFSTAVSEAEAIEEARWVADLIATYKITYPVVYDCEGYGKTESRQYELTKEERTEIAKAFLNEIYEQGYTPMFYGSKAEMEEDRQWVASELEKSYKVWVSWYPEKPYPETAQAGYAGNHDMWQYTNKGTVAGIDYAVDLNVAYFGYENEAAAKEDTAPQQVGASVEAGHNFTQVNETITAKEVTNLRNIPSQGDDSRVMCTLKNGETATRTGVSTSGWSRVVYNGETYYAVSSLLTTDLHVKAPEPTPEPDDGIKTVFAARDEMVSPKMEVNLRTLPSVTHPDSWVVVKLPYGSVVKRTGINEDLGWSRVEYEGQTLYCVSSYVYVME